MQSPLKSYLKEMHKKFGYRANWEPHRPIELGAIGKFHRGIFSEYSTLEKKGIQIEEGKNSGNNIEHVSSGKVSTDIKLSGKSAPPTATSLKAEADAGLIISFNAENAIMFKANDIIYHTIKNLEEVGKKVIKLFSEGKWDKDFVIITDIIEAQSATILLSKSKNAKVEIKIAGEINAKNIDVADTSLGLSIVSQRGLATKIISEGGLHPLYRCMKVKRRFLSNTPDLNIKNFQSSESELLVDKLEFSEDEFNQDTIIE